MAKPSSLAALFFSIVKGCRVIEILMTLINGKTSLSGDRSAGPKSPEALYFSSVVNPAARMAPIFYYRHVAGRALLTGGRLNRAPLAANALGLGRQLVARSVDSIGGQFFDLDGAEVQKDPGLQYILGPLHRGRALSGH
jgi:hypothetical protein